MFRAVATFAVLALNSNFARAAGPPTRPLTFWHKDNATRPFIDKVAAEFSAQTGRTVTVELIGVDQYKTSLLKMGLEKTLPDMALVPSDFVGLHQFLRLSPVPPSVIDAPLANAMLETARAAGKLYGVPVIAGNHLVLYYNKRFVATPAGNWEELRGQAPELRKQGVKPIGWNYAEMYWFAPFVQAFGGKFLKGRVVTLATPEMAEALAFYRQLADDGIIDKACTYDCNAKRFLAGEFAYAINGDWAFQEAHKALGENLGIAALPRIGKRAMPAQFGTQSLVFPEQGLAGPNHDIMVRFARFLTSAAVQTRFFTEAERIPVHPKAIAAATAAATGSLKSLITQMAEAKVMPSEPEMAYAWEGMRRGFARYMGGKLTPEATAKIMQQAAEEERKNASKLLDKK